MTGTTIALHRRAMTLLETIIALALFAVMMAMVMEGLVGLRGFVTQHERLGDLEGEARDVLRKITQDLGNSAWFLTMDANRNPIMDQSFPWVIKGVPNVDLGDQLVFMKVRTGGASDLTTVGSAVEHINFDTDVAVPMSQYCNAKPVASLVLNSGYLTEQDVFVSAVWEAKNTGLSFDANNQVVNLRQYRYQLIIDDQTGLGNLVRFYRDSGVVDHDLAAGDPWIQDTILGGNIKSLVIDTNLTRPSLNLNQIHIAVTLEIDDHTPASARATRTFETTIAMRSITNALTN